MRLGVISDTHLARAGSGIVENVRKHFEGVDLILHAGDIVDPAVIQELETLAPVRAVAGNMDAPSILQRFPRKCTIPVADHQIGLIHGDGIPGRLRLLAEFGSVSAVVFGHTHRPCLHVERDVLFFNPGSTVASRTNSRPSVGRLVVGRGITGEILPL